MKSTNLHSLETVENGKSIATLTQAMTSVERKLDDTIPRREVDPRVSQLESEMKHLVSRIRELELLPKASRQP
jgi:hypothetical protein